MGSYEDFLINYGDEIKESIMKIREGQRYTNKVLEDGDLTEVEYAREMERIEKKLKRIYDKYNVDYVMGWFDDIESPDIREIMRIGMEISNRYGTEPHMVLEAINDAHYQIMKLGE